MKDLRAILEKVDWELDGIQVKGSRKQIIDLAIAEIRALVNEDLKFGKDYNKDSNCDSNYVYGHNDCRNKTLERMGE